MPIRGGVDNCIEELEVQSVRKCVLAMSVERVCMECYEIFVLFCLDDGVLPILCKHKDLS